jgi:hypothetical protein
MSAYMQYEHESGVVARWHGGAYIELGYLADCEFSASDVINVWDYATDTPRIDRTLDALQAKVDERLADEDEDA